MRRKTQIRKLKLTVDTIRRLTADQLAVAAGGCDTTSFTTELATGGGGCTNTCSKPCC